MMAFRFRRPISVCLRKSIRVASFLRRVVSVSSWELSTFKSIGGLDRLEDLLVRRVKLSPRGVNSCFTSRYVSISSSLWTLCRPPPPHLWPYTESHRRRPQCAASLASRKLTRPGLNQTSTMSPLGSQSVVCRTKGTTFIHSISI